MNKAGGAFYERLPSRQLRRFLAPDGMLAPLLATRMVADVGLELHLRRGDEVHLYCGLTCLVKCGPDGRGSVWFESHGTYACQPCARRLFRPERSGRVGRGDRFRCAWTVGEHGLGEALDSFLAGVWVDPRQTREGAVQDRWSRIREPWIAIDKEAALAYPSMAERRRHLSEVFRATVDEARSELRALALSRRSLRRRARRSAKPRPGPTARRSPCPASAPSVRTRCRSEGPGR